MTGLYVVAVTLARGADIQTCVVRLAPGQLDALTALFAILVELGRVATFSIEPLQSLTFDEVLLRLKRRVGSLVVDAVSGQPAPRGPTPSFLMPVWAFDHEFGGAPAATANFLGLDLELIAVPSPDEELGVVLPGHDGRWLVYARPLSTGASLFPEGPTTNR